MPVIMKKINFRNIEDLEHYWSFAFALQNDCKKTKEAGKEVFISLEDVEKDFTSFLRTMTFEKLDSLDIVFPNELSGTYGFFEDGRMLGIIIISGDMETPGFLEESIACLNRARSKGFGSTMVRMFAEYATPFIGTTLNIFSEVGDMVVIKEAKLEGIIASIDIANPASLIIHAKSGYSLHHSRELSFSKEHSAKPFCHAVYLSYPPCAMPAYDDHLRAQNKISAITDPSTREMAISTLSNNFEQARYTHETILFSFEIQKAQHRLLSNEEVDTAPVVSHAAVVPF